MKWLVLVLLVIILASLFSALYYLVKDKGESTRTVKALTIRISLSIALFILLVAGYKLGWIEPHALPTTHNSSPIRE